MIKSFVLASIFTSIVFLIIDIIWLSITVKLLYRPAIGNLLNDKPVLWAAGLFYIIYILGLAFVIIRPAIYNNSSIQALCMGFIFGLVAYGTYNLTNMATVKGWSPSVVFVDMLWGGSLTAFSSYSGISIAKKFLF